MHSTAHLRWETCSLSVVAAAGQEGQWDGPGSVTLSAGGHALPEHEHARGGGGGSYLESLSCWRKETDGQTDRQKISVSKGLDSSFHL